MDYNEFLSVLETSEKSEHILFPDGFKDKVIIPITCHVSLELHGNVEMIISRQFLRIKNVCCALKSEEMIGAIFYFDHFHYDVRDKPDRIKAYITEPPRFDFEDEELKTYEKILYKFIVLNELFDMPKLSRRVEIDITNGYSARSMISGQTIIKCATIEKFAEAISERFPNCVSV